MTPEEHKKIKEIFLEACGLEAGRRREFLDGACGGDAALRAAVEELLEGDRDFLPPLEALLPEGGIPATALAGALPSPGRTLTGTLGRYRIIRKLGEGGMGAVYEAEQDSPRRTVALKVLQQGAVTRSLMRRFELEAEVLGQLQHPGIAHIYEAGASGDGEPFFAMELVRGRPVTVHADAENLGIAERLELVARISDAVQHAHQKGVIHRDLKPGNILVDRMGQPKVLDFGVARVTDADIQTATLQTTVGQIVGTLPYMSPEQATGDPASLDTRSDVYSLGVILSELLTGRLPHDLSSRPLHEALRIIREDEPRRLSTTSRALRGDVETIVQKALEKDKSRRYQSAAELGADIRRFLNNEPIVARPTTAFYQLRKFARRNKALVGGATVAFFAMLVGTIVAVWYALIAHQRTGEALFQAYRARLAAAAAAIETDDPSVAHEQLAAVDVDRRGWEWRYWWSEIDRSVAVFEAGEHVAGAAFGDGGSRVVVARGDGSVTWWDPFRGEEILSRSLGTDFIRAAAFSRDGGRMAAVTGPDLRALALWDAASGERLATLEGLEAPCHSLAMTPTADYIVGTSQQAAAWIWDGKSPRARPLDPESLPTATRPRPIAFQPGVDRFLVSGQGSWLGFFDLEGNRLESRKIASATICSLTFTGEGSRLALGDGNNKVYVARVGADRPLAELRGHRAPVEGVAFSPDDRLLASAGDRTVRVWDLSSSRAAAVLTGHTAEVRRVVFSPDGSHLLSVSLDRTVRLWKSPPAADPSVLRIPESHCRDIAPSPDGRRVVCPSWHHHMLIWDIASGDVLGDLLADREERPGRTSGVAVSPGSGEYIATGHRHGELVLWSARTGERLATARPRPGERSELRLAFHPGGSRLATVSTAGTVRLWSVPDLEPLAHFQGERGRGWEIVYSPDGRRLAAGIDRSVVLLDAETLEPRRRLEGHSGRVLGLAFSPDGDLLASGSGDRTVRLWDLDRPAVVGEFRGHLAAVYSLAFSPDGSRLASGSGDTTIRVWDTATREEVIQLHGQFGTIYALEYSPDGSRLFSASSEGIVRIWDTAPREKRWQARFRRRELLEEARPRVSRLFEELGDAGRVVEQIEADASLDPRHREAALQAALEISLRRLRDRRSE